VPLSRGEEALLDDLFRSFMKRQGFAPESTANNVVARQFLHGWAAHEFLHDAARKLSSKRRSVAKRRAADVERERRAAAEAEAATQRRASRLAGLGLGPEAAGVWADSEPGLAEAAVPAVPA
jgi:hypothetical protein